MPAVSEANERADENQPKRVKKKVGFALLITLLVSVPCAIGLYFFAPTLVGVVYRSLSGAEKETLIGLVKAFSVSAVTLSCLQTTSACLTAQGKPRLSMISMAIGVVVKLGLEFLLVSNPSVSIMGAVVASNVCYALVFLLDLFFHIRLNKRKKKAAELSC